GKARHHLPCLNLALRHVPHDRRRGRDQPARLIAFLEAVTRGAGQGQKDHERWLLARHLLERKLAGRRKHSKLPALIDFVLARPLVSAGMMAAELGSTARGGHGVTGPRPSPAWGLA